MLKTTPDSNSGSLEACSVLMKNLCLEVWPLLAVLGNVDPGFRLGGECLVAEGRKGIVADLPSGKMLKIQEVFDEGADKLEQK